MTQPFILDVSSVVALEKAIEDAGTPLTTLMERAGGAVARTTLDVLGDGASGAKVVIFAGGGNNGGDGWVAARDLARAGCAVTLVTPKAADELRAEPARSWATRVAAADLPRLTILVAPDDAMVRDVLATAAIVIDGLLGTGFSGASVRAPLGRWIELLAERENAPTPKRPFVIAIDVPSGVSAQTGRVATPSVRADRTATMLALKPGLLATAAKLHVGALAVDDLGVDVAPLLSETILRHGVPGDLDALMAFYELMIEVTTGTDNDPLWLSGNHPSREGLAASIDAGEMIVAEHRDTREIVGAAVIDQRWNAGYDQGDWQIPADPDQVWTLHLVAVHPRCQHQGVGRGLLDYAMECARAAGGSVMRIDVLATNRVSLQIYERWGFRRVGPVELHYDDPRVTDFVLFEKAL